MTKRMVFPVFISIILFLPSCSSVRISNGKNIKNFKLTEKNPVVHINAEIWGIHLFNGIPLFSGGYIQVGTTKPFSTTAKIENVMTIIKNEAKKLGATRIIDINSKCISSWNAYTLIFWYKEVQISATAVKDKEPSKDKNLPGIYL